MSEFCSNIELLMPNDSKLIIYCFKRFAYSLLHILRNLSLIVIQSFVHYSFGSNLHAKLYETAHTIMQCVYKIVFDRNMHNELLYTYAKRHDKFNINAFELPT